MTWSSSRVANGIKAREVPADEDDSVAIASAAGSGILWGGEKKPVTGRWTDIMKKRKM